MTWLTRQILLCIALVLLLCLSLSGGADAETTLTWQTSDTPPFWGEDLPDNGMGGEILEALSKYVGNTNTFIYLPMERIFRTPSLPGNWTGNPQIFPEEWSAVVPIMTLQAAVFFFAPHHEQPPRFRNWNSLRGMTLGVVRGVMREEDKVAFGKLGITVEDSRTEELLLHKLLRGRIDACFMVQATGIFLIQRIFPNQADRFIHFAVRDTEAPIALMLAKDQPDGAALGNMFNTALDRLIESGEYENILEKYYGAGKIPPYWQMTLEKFRTQYKNE